MEEALSPVMEMFALFRRNSMTATGHSWTRMNGAYSGIMKALIVGGVKFELEDFSRVTQARITAEAVLISATRR